MTVGSIFVFYFLNYLFRCFIYCIAFYSFKYISSPCTNKATNSTKALLLVVIMKVYAILKVASVKQMEVYSLVKYDLFNLAWLFIVSAASQLYCYWKKPAFIVTSQRGAHWCIYTYCRDIFVSLLTTAAAFRALHSRGKSLLYEVITTKTDWCGGRKKLLTS